MSGIAIRKSAGERTFLAVNNVILVLLGLITLFPFYSVIINSMAPPVDYIMKDINVWPSRFDFSYYRIVFEKGSSIYNAYKITVFITVAGTALNMLMTIITAYALSVKTLPFRTPITLFLVFTMYFSGGMIPDFLVVRSLGMLNTIWALLIPGALATYYVLLMRNFFMNIPAELKESAKIDGCSDIGMITRIILPLSVAAIATISLFYAVAHWNQFYSGVIFITNPKLQPLQVYLRQILYDAELQADFKLMEQMRIDGYQPPSEGIKAATIMAATLPIVCVYPFVQRYFVKGIMVGSLKG